MVPLLLFFAAVFMSTGEVVADQGFFSALMTTGPALPDAYLALMLQFLGRWGSILTERPNLIELVTRARNRR